jgi:anti-anti-sigma factor
MAPMESIPLHSKLIAAVRLDGEGVMILEVAGDISFEAAALLRKDVFALLDKHAVKRLILNLRQVSYLGSGGFGVIIELLRKIPQERGVILTNVHPNVLGVIKVMKLTSIFTVAADDQDALAM